MPPHNDNESLEVKEKEMEVTETVGEEEQKETGKYPKIVLLIVLNELCERFSYYGLKTVLFIYLSQFVSLSDNTATAIYHAFSMICYFTPVIGAIIADGYIGLYRTILYVSCLYCVGEIILCLTALVPLGAPNVAGPIIGLIIIALGTGGIKPCVAAFGGNQFGTGQKRFLGSFFSMFYMAINVGSLISTIITPILRSDVKCYNYDCYPLAFGVPAIFMLLAIVLFAIGTPFYNRSDEIKKPGARNVIVETFGCIVHAIRNKISGDNKNGQTHWLERANDTYSSRTIEDVKIFCKVALVFLPLPVFWALFDQQGSRWTAQAQQLNGRIGSITIKPDQFQAVNPVLIVVLVPIFDSFVYPVFAKCGLFKNLLHRMAAGLVLGIVAFCISAGLEWQMQVATDKYNPVNNLRIINLSPCQLTLMHGDDKVFDMTGYVKNTKNQYELPQSIIDDILQNKQKFYYEGTCPNGPIDLTEISADKIDKKHLPKTLLFTGTTEIKTTVLPYSTKAQKIGTSGLTFALLDTADRFPDLTPKLVTKGQDYDYKYMNLTSGEIKTDVANYTNIDYKEWDLTATGAKLSGTFLTETCGKYTVLIFPDLANTENLDFIVLTDVTPNGLHLGLQVIQIFVMSLGEIMFSVSGLAFAYAQAPATMKSVLQSVWLMTVAFGNLIVVIIAEAKITDNQAIEYIIFAGLLALATVAFMILSYFYVDTHLTDNKNVDEKKNEKEQEAETSSRNRNFTAAYYKSNAVGDLKVNQALQFSEDGTVVIGEQS